MARNWSKNRSRALSNASRASEIDDSRYAAESDGLAERRPKSELRAETDALVAQFRGKVRQLPTYAGLRCRSCGHRGTARVPSGQSPAFRCSKCRSTLVAYRV